MTRLLKYTKTNPVRFWLKLKLTEMYILPGFPLLTLVNVWEKWVNDAYTNDNKLRILKGSGVLTVVNFYK